MLKNLLSVFGLNVFRAVIQFFMTLALTRFIGPADYGVMAFVLPFWTFISLVSDFGLSNAIVREQSLTRRQAGAAVNFCIAMTFLGAFLMLALAWPLGRMMNEPKVAWAMTAFSVVFSLAMMSTIPRAMLERQLNYRTLAAIEAVAAFGGIPLCLGMAIHGAGLWSLITYHLTVQTIRLIGFFRYGHHNIEWTSHWRDAIPLAKFGGWVLVYNAQNFLARNADNIIVGFYLGATALGVYAITYQVMILPLTTLTWPASGVLLATISRLQNDLLKVRQYIASLLSLTSAATFPGMVYLTFGAQYPFNAYMSPAWHDVPKLLAWLAPVGAIQSVAAFGGAVLTAQGKMKLYLSLGVANTLTFLVIFFITAQIRLEALVIAYAVAATIGSFGYLIALAYALEVSVMKLLSWLAAGIGTTIVGLALVLLFRLVDVPNAGLRWLVDTAAYGTAVLASFIICKKYFYQQIAFLSSKFV